LLCDAAAILSIGLAECAGRIFQNYLHPAEKDELATHLRMLIWGGKEQYEFIRMAYQRLQEAKGAVDLEPLELPEWNSFLQLVRNLLEQPGKSFEIPWLLRQYAIDLFRNRSMQRRLTRGDLVTLKQGMLVLSYVCKAAGVPREFEAALVGELVRLQAVLANTTSPQGADER
jgi:hypothetical protein